MKRSVASVLATWPVNPNTGCVKAWQFRWLVSDEATINLLCLAFLAKIESFKIPQIMTLELVENCCFSASPTSSQTSRLNCQELGPPTFITVVYPLCTESANHECVLMVKLPNCQPIVYEGFINIVSWIYSRVPPPFWHRHTVTINLICSRSCFMVSWMGKGSNPKPW